MRPGTTNNRGGSILVLTFPARNRNQYARPRQVFFDEHTHTLAAVAVESFGRPRKKLYEMLEQVGASILGGTDGEFLPWEGVFNEAVHVSNNIPINLGNHPGSGAPI